VKKAVKKRIVKNYSVRRTEIINVAQKRFYADGYERTSIQDLIDELGIAKGTFYHYFGSKQELLDAIVERMLEKSLAAIEPIVDDEGLDVLEKFGRVFASLEGWRMYDHDSLIFLEVWHQDENAILREMSRRASLKSVTPLLAEIIHQGTRQGVFVTDNPFDVAEIVLIIGLSLAQAVEESLLEAEPGRDALELVERKIAAYERAVERLLGAPQDALRIYELDRVKRWPS
jgi:AcrR family transcriptional regulator